MSRCANYRLQFILTLDLQDGAGLKEVSGDGFEIFHVRADNDGHACGGGFKDVVATSGRDGTANEHDVRERERAGQLTNGIE